MKIEYIVRQDLIKLQDVKFKKFHSSLCPGTTNIIGIKIPILREYAKNLYKNKNSKEYIFFNDTKYYEEVMIQAILIGLNKNIDINEIFKMITNFVPKIDNWAICDTFCCGLKVINKNKESFWNFIQPYLKSNKEFELRFAIVIILNYFIDDKYINKVLKILDNIKHDGYYVKMAIAWAISIAFIKFQDVTMNYLKDNNLDNWTYNKSLQKITESLRVSSCTKELIKKMKIG